MAINITFGGATIRRPGAYAIVDTTNMVPVTLGAMRGLAFVGELDEGATLEPGRVYAFTDPSEARKALKQGDTLDAMNVAWQHGADLIYVSGVNKSTAASITLKDGTTTDLMKLTSKIYGTDGNAITVTVTATDLTIALGAASEVYKLETKSMAELSAEINGASKLVISGVIAAGTLGVLSTTNLSGGGAGPDVTDTDWQDAIDLLETEFLDGVIPVSTEAAIQAKVDAHVQAMSSVKNRRRRRGFYGHAVGASVDDILASAMAISDERALLASPCPLIADSTGNKVAKPSYFTAAAAAGIWAGQDPQEPITYKLVKFSGLEVQYKANEIETLLGGHVCVVEVVRNVGYRIVQGCTTDSSADLTKNELSVSTLKDMMSGNLETYFENKYVGKAGVAGIEVTIYNDLVSMLELFIKNNWISGYVADSVQVRKSGTAFYLEWEGTPTLPINNFLITTNLSL